MSYNISHNIYHIVKTVLSFSLAVIITEISEGSSPAIRYKQRVNYQEMISVNQDLALTHNRNHAFLFYIFCLYLILFATYVISAVR